MANSIIPRSWEDSFADDFLAQPAQITADERDQIETRAGGDDDAIVRRLALASLTRSGAELIESVSVSREMAVSTAHAADRVEDYANRLRSLADMMRSASMRLNIALCAREDMESVLEEAKALEDGTDVGHG
jgi:hypothetical protein